MIPNDPARCAPARIVPDDSQPEARPETPVAQALAGWLQQMARTIKTCRLYDAGNPTVVTFRRDLATALFALLKEHGAVRIGFTTNEIFLDQTPLYSARSREDNLALPFFRDGIRSMSLRPDIPQREVDAVLDAILHVTRRGGEESDLVTLLWETDLAHVGIEYVSTEGGVESGGEDGAEGADSPAAPIAPWPATAPRDAPAAATPGAFATEDEPAIDDTGRSDDRITAGQPRKTEASLIGLEIVAEEEIERFRREHDAERAMPESRRGLELISACLAHTLREEDRSELRRFVPRPLHGCVAAGDWSSARECLWLLRAPGEAGDAVGAFARELARPESLTSAQAWKCLDRQTSEQQDQFFEFARELGPEATDWLMRGIAESQRRGLRSGLARALAGIIPDNPELLAPWLADSRWYVVRNVVHILGLMDRDVPVGLLRVASTHPEFRVRREVVTALARAPRAVARPILIDMLNAADSRLLGIILHNLSTTLDSDLAEMMLAWIEEAEFESRPEVVKRAVYQALAASGGDAVVPLLEAQVLQGGWFSRGKEEARTAAAMCLARIGTVAARELLERGAKSRRGEVARACNTALAALRPPS